MLTITIEDAFRLLEECAALSTEDGDLFYPHLDELTGEEQHAFAEFRWHSDDGEEYTRSFFEADNQSVDISGGCIELVDNYGTCDSYYLLASMEAEKLIANRRKDEYGDTE